MEEGNKGERLDGQLDTAFWHILLNGYVSYRRPRPLEFFVATRIKLLLNSNIGVSNKSGIIR